MTCFFSDAEAITCGFTLRPSQIKESQSSTSNPSEGCGSPTHIFNLLNLKPMNHQTKAKLEAAIGTGYIMLTTCLGIIVFGRFIYALITN